MRFLGPVRSFPEPYLTGATEGASGHVALVAEAPGALVAVAGCIDVSDGVADLGVLVEDAYQQRGIGALARLVQYAHERGLLDLAATVPGEQAWVLNVLRSYGPVEAPMSYGVFEMTLRRDRRFGR